MRKAFLLQVTPAGGEGQDIYLREGALPQGPPDNAGDGFPPLRCQIQHRFVHGPVETLDHASRLPLYGSKMGVDATLKWRPPGRRPQGVPVTKGNWSRCQGLRAPAR